MYLLTKYIESKDYYQLDFDEMNSMFLYKLIWNKGFRYEICNLFEHIIVYEAQDILNVNNDIDLDKK